MVSKESELKTRTVRFLDLRVTNDVEREELIACVDAVFRHGRMINGPEVEALECQVAKRIERSYAVGTGSGTAALFVALKAFGIGPGDEVITTSLSWVATANAIALTGATPVFADIGDDLNIDPGSVERLVSESTRAILPVHYTGKVCRMDALQAIAQAHGLIVVEDACQAFDATYRGRLAGGFGDVACFSMNSMKVLASCGEAGMVLTDSEEVYDRLRALRYNGTVNKEKCVTPSLNARLATLQAAILVPRLRRVAQLIDRRRELAERYHEKLADVVRVPREETDARDVYYTYTIQAERRDELKAHLEERRIETKVQHPILMPQQPAYRSGARGEWSHAKELVERILCLPVHEKLALDDVDYVASCIREFYGVDDT